jgi:hypothetical protein
MNTSAVIFCSKQLYVEARDLAIAEHTFPVEGLPDPCELGSTGWRPPRNTAFDILRIDCDPKTHVVKRVYY